MLNSKNQMIMTEINDHLEHHGIMGMRWGKRNGPPYPLAPSAHSYSEKKAGWEQSLSSDSPSIVGSSFDRKVAKAEEKRRKAKEKSLEKARKAQKRKREEEAKELKRQAKDEKQAAKIQKMKEDLLRKGDIEAISKKSKYFTNEELQYAQNRYMLMQNTKKLSTTQQTQKQPQQKQDRTKAPDGLQWLSNNLGTIAKISTAALTTATAVKKLKDMSGGGSKSNNLASQNKEKSDSKDTVLAKDAAVSKKIADTPVSKIPESFSPKEVAKLTSTTTGYSQDLKPGKTKSFVSDAVIKSYDTPVSTVKKQEYTTPSLDFTIIRDMSINTMPDLDMSSLRKK